jgi:putative ABC transport system permease protein
VTFAFTLRAIVTSWRRVLLTALVVAVGVAMVSGALVFTDTTKAAFNQLFTGASQGSQVIVSGRQQVATGSPGATAIPVSLIARVSRLRGVAAARGQIQQPVTIVGADGRPVNEQPAPIALSTLPAPFTDISILKGELPHGIGEVVVDAGTAARQHWQIGDRITLVTGQPARRFTISGIALLGNQSGGGQPFVAFGLSAAQALYSLPKQVNTIEVATRPGAALTAVVSDVRRLLPPTLVARDAASAVNVDVHRVASSFGSLNDGLLAFAIVAALAGALIIFNTFTITATHRAGELALLRTLGATRPQIIRSALLEALIIGVLGAILGLFAGPFLALLVRTLFNHAGVGLPNANLVLRPQALEIGAAVGIVVTLLAALIPAARATAAAPLEALRLTAGHRTNPDRLDGPRGMFVRAVLAAGLAAAGLIVILSASGDEASRLRACAIGGALVVVAGLVAGALVVRVVGGVGGLLSRRRRRPIGELAHEHALQHPGRTALSASSLTIGLTLTLLIAAYVGGLRAATTAAIGQSVVGDVAIQAQDGTSSIPATTVRAAVAIPDLEGISSLKTDTGTLARAGTVQVAGIDPTSWGEVYRFDWLQGSSASLANLSAGQVLVEADTARAAGLHLGSRTVLMTNAGQRVPVRVAGIYQDAGLLHGVTVPLSWFDQLFDQSRLAGVFIKLTGAVSHRVALLALNRALTQFPGVVARDQTQIAARLRTNVDGVVDLLYALLVLSVVMSLLGIGGALNLSVRARTSEIGMLRALGMTPAQARTLVRDESMLTAAIGGLSGIVLGLVLGVAVTHALRTEGFAFSFPWLPLIGVVVADLLAGTLAAVAPARRVARIDVLAAIAHE